MAEETTRAQYDDCNEIRLSPSLCVLQMEKRDGGGTYIVHIKKEEGGGKTRRGFDGFKGIPAVQWAF